MTPKAYQSFWRYALNILAHRDYCQQQVRQKLQQRETPADGIDYIIQRLLDLNYLDDHRFTQNFFRMQLSRGQSLKHIAYKAQSKGVTRNHIELVLAELHDVQDDTSVCKALISKRDPQNLYQHDTKKKRRLMHFLQRRGFDADSILRAFYDLEQET
ncbi:MAG: regulatory protein RecX [Mariprofundaceae bacterium]|nr:regulatory protein RecX [Mariprofundaceae bacterium]